MANPYIPKDKKPHPRQAEFLLRMEKEVLYGGAAGGGKSNGLLMAALQFVSFPNYSAILFRNSITDAGQSGALIPKSHEWLGSTDARWSEQKKVWTFSSGATLAFAYLDSKDDRYRYLSSEYQFIGFDELTLFKEDDYTFLFSRLRRNVDSKVPLRMRGGTNPGGPGMMWVKKRFLTPEAKAAGRVFVPATIKDNPSLPLDEYMETLENLPYHTRQQYMHGDWSDFQGNLFFPGDWPRYENRGDAWGLPLPGGIKREIHRHLDCTHITAVDWALGSKAIPQKNVGLPCFTAIVTAAMTSTGRVMILDVRNERLAVEENVKELAEVCEIYRPAIVAADDDMIAKSLLVECRRHREIPEMRLLSIGGNNKAARATASMIRAEKGMIYLPQFAPWLEEYMGQLAAFTGTDKDQFNDMADATGIIGRIADQLKPEAASRGQQGPAVFSDVRNTFGAW